MRGPILLFVLNFWFSFLTAQTSSIKGKVLSSDQRAAEFVLVSIRNTTIGTISNAAGEFSLIGLSPGTITITAGMNGSSYFEKEITLNEENKELELIIQLKNSSRDLEEVTVSTVFSQNEKKVSIGKMAIKAMDLPQSISVIEKDVLEKQQTLNMSDALKNFNGVYQMGNTGGVQQEIAARGFAFGSSNTFKNGVRFNNTVMPEMSALERVEVLKGSAAILYGNVSAGGVINLVTKKANFQKGGEISMRGGSYAFYKPSFDIYGLLDEHAKVAYRLNSTYENAGSFRNQVSSQRIYFNPSFAFKLGKKTELLIEGDYLNDHRTADFGVGSINYQLVDVPRSLFLGAAWSYYQTEQKSVTATISHAFNRNWQMKSTSSAQLFSNDLFSTLRPNSNNQAIRPDGTWIRGLQRTKINDQYFISQLDLTGKFNTGALKHNILIGGDLDHYSTLTSAYNNLGKYDSINIYNMDQYQQRKDIPDLTKKTDTEVPIQRAGAYVQDLVDFGKIKVLAGIRLSYMETGSRVFTYGTNTFSISSQKNLANTPRLGLVYQPTKQLSVFGSYANSFAPNTGVDISGQSLAPSYFNQVEAGLKSNWFKNRLSANITAYQIINSNLAQTDLSNGNTNTNIKELAGEVTSKGLELDLQTKSLNGFMIIAGYSYNETRYTKSNTYVVGSLLRYNPNHTANSSVYYTFEKGTFRGLNLGMSALYFGERMAGRSTRVTVENDPYKLIQLPAYTLIDLSAAYQIKSFAIRLKVSNLLNALSYNVHDDNSVNPIAPRQFSATFSHKF